MKEADKRIHFKNALMAQQEAFQKKIAGLPALTHVIDRDNPGAVPETKDRIIALFRLAGVTLPSQSYRKLIDKKWNAFPPEWITRDGQVIVFRGDKDNLHVICSRQLSKGLTLDSAVKLEKMRPKDDLYGKNVLDELMASQSNNGNGPFISTSTKLYIARKHPNYQEVEGSVYVLKVPLHRVIRNYCSQVSGSEDEYLIPDIVYSEDIIAVFSKQSPRLQALADRLDENNRYGIHRAPKWKVVEEFIAELPKK